MGRAIIIVAAVVSVPTALFAALVPIGIALKLDDLPDHGLSSFFVWTSLVAPYIWLNPRPFPTTLALGVPVLTWCLVGVVVDRFTRARTVGHTAAIAFGAVVVVGAAILFMLLSFNYRIAFEGS